MNIKTKKIINIFFMLSAVLGILFTEKNVFADTPAATTATSGTDAITQTICNVEIFITSGPGKAVVVVVIISTGFGMFFGKITWVTAIIILIGIGITFGASSIVGTITGGNFSCSSANFIK